MVKAGDRIVGTRERLQIGSFSNPSLNSIFRTREKGQHEKDCPSKADFVPLGTLRESMSNTSIVPGAPGADDFFSVYSPCKCLLGSRIIQLGPLTIGIQKPVSSKTITEISDYFSIRDSKSICFTSTSQDCVLAVLINEASNAYIVRWWHVGNGLKKKASGGLGLDRRFPKQKFLLIQVRKLELSVLLL